MNKQITAADRKAIEVLLKENYTPSSIAEKLGFHRSTICREINNRSNPNGYSAFTAQCNYEDCKKGVKGKVSLISLVLKTMYTKN